MLVDAKSSHFGFTEIRAAAGLNEALGYDGMWSSESKHDPFLPLLVAAEQTKRLRLGSSIAVALARSPMTTASTAHDLVAYTDGRFMLGLGSQIKPHIERRFSMPWSQPALRMREYICALKAIWRCWDEGEALDFRGDFYQHTLMTPFFAPPPNPAPPPVYLAAVGTAMTEVAGEVAEGVFVHGFTTERYLREVTMPAVQKGLSTSGRERETFSVSYLGFVVTGETEEQLAGARRAVTEQIAFYGSTPAYRQVLELHGWGELHVELNRLSRSGEDGSWRRMGELIDDEVLDAFAVVAEPPDVAAEILKRFSGTVDRFTFYTPYETRPELWTSVIDELHNG